jgi:agmatinase
MNFPENFLGLQEKYSGYSSAKVVILPVPYEGTVSYGKGTSNGPKAIIAASPQLEYYDEEIGVEQFEVGIHTLPELKKKQNPESMVDAVRLQVKEHLKSGKFIVVLGGEHSITTGEVKAYAENYGDLSILQFDAHADLRDEYDGEKHSHACAMRRAYEICPSIVQIGIRNISKDEVDFVKQAGHSGIFYAHEIMKSKDWVKRAVSKLKKNVFITIDLDVFDSGIMPATGTPEPGGLDWYQVTSVLKEVAKTRNIVGFDIVELAPDKSLHSCDFLAAKLAYRLIGYRFYPERL